MEGRWLDIPDEAKSGVARNVELNETLQFIFIEYESWFTEGYGSTIKDAGEHISKMFKKALNSIELLRINIFILSGTPMLFVACSKACPYTT